MFAGFFVVKTNKSLFCAEKQLIGALSCDAFKDPGMVQDRQLGWGHLFVVRAGADGPHGSFSLRKKPVS